MQENVLHVEVIETPDLGDRSYVAHDGEFAIVLDPQRDIGRIQEVIAEHGLEVALVAETHLHNDYVTGGYDLARRAGAEYLLSAEDDVDFPRRKVADGDTIDVGGLHLDRAVDAGAHLYAHVLRGR